jgi:hypothetical protein
MNLHRDSNELDSKFANSLSSNGLSSGLTNNFSQSVASRVTPQTSTFARSSNNTGKDTTPFSVPTVPILSSTANMQLKPDARVSLPDMTKQLAAKVDQKLALHTLHSSTGIPYRPDASQSADLRNLKRPLEGQPDENASKRMYISYFATSSHLVKVVT